MPVLNAVYGIPVPSAMREKVVKIGAKVIAHTRYTIFQLAEVAIPRHLFAIILRLVVRLRAPPAPA